GKWRVLTWKPLVASPAGTGWIVRFAGTLAGAVRAPLTGNGSGLTGGINHSRLTSIIYPATGTSAKTVTYNYATGLDTTISRLSSLTDNARVTLGGERGHSDYSCGLDLTYITAGGSGDAGDQYTGLDRFGRIVDQKWQVNTTPTPTITDEFKYGYDRDGNRLYRDNFSEYCIR